MAMTDVEAGESRGADSRPDVEQPGEPTGHDLSDGLLREGMGGVGLPRDAELVIYAAWRDRSVARIRGPSCDVYPRARKWTRTVHGRWQSPYDAAVYVRGEAMHIEREISRRELERALLEAGRVVLTKGNRMLPYCVIEAAANSKELFKG